ncbi:hypothetical protein MYX82_02775 [Acidobacteria bacterium AH-259-D05]|nr:hypothetical protein [Acidobacteria bacterium AH-259-D05]
MNCKKCGSETEFEEFCAGCNRCLECCECEIPLTLGLKRKGISMGAGRYPPGYAAVMGKSLRDEMDRITGGPSAQAAMREQIRQNFKDSMNPGGSGWAPPAPKAWYEKP